MPSRSTAPIPPADETSDAFRTPWPWPTEVDRDECNIYYRRNAVKTATATGTDQAESPVPCEAYLHGFDSIDEIGRVNRLQPLITICMAVAVTDPILFTIPQARALRAALDELIDAASVVGGDSAGVHPVTRQVPDVDESARNF